MIPILKTAFVFLCISTVAISIADAKSGGRSGKGDTASKNTGAAKNAEPGRSDQRWSCYSRSHQRGIGRRPRGAARLYPTRVAAKGTDRSGEQGQRRLSRGRSPLRQSANRAAPLSAGLPFS
jgi:hypothetical protein